jgi:hypothetical protein
MESEEIETAAEAPPIAHCYRRVEKCKCRDEGQPVNGWIYISPACPIHYHRQIIFSPFSEITEEEVASWQHPERHRITYPKMTVKKP